jgi:ADP-heptose:LPS heptosyltransferase
VARTNNRHRLLDYWLGVPLVALAGSLRRRRSIPSNVQRIGVFSPTAIGDLILDSGILLHLRQAFPFATIHLFYGPTNAGVVPLLQVDVQAHCCDFKRTRATLAEIRQAQLDIVIDLTPWPRLTALYAALSGATTIGFRAERQHRHYAFDVAVPHLSTRHEVDNLRALAEVFAPCKEYRVALRQDLPEPALALPYDRLVLCHISPGGSQADTKRWPVQHWVELVRRLSADGYIIGFTGSDADDAAAQEVISAARLPAESLLSLCGKMSLADLAGALRKARLLITVDTGILHMASALHANTVALHGPTRSWRWGARSPATISLDAPHPAAGFIHLGFETNDQGAATMQTLSVDRVHDAAKDALQRREKTAAPFTVTAPRDASFAHR